MEFCTNCGNNLQPNSNFCDKCGTPVSRKTTPTELNQTKSKRKGKSKSSTSGFTIFLVAIILTIAVMVIINSKDKSSKGHSATSSSIYNTDKNTPSNKYRNKKYAHNKINLRSGRGTNFKIVGNLDRGEMVEVDSLKEGWFIVYKNGIKKGFVYSKLLKDYPLPDFEIVSWNWYTDPSFGIEGSVIWNVEVRNNTSRYVEYLEVEFTTYDGSGNIMDSDFTYVKGLSPGGTSSAKAYATYFGKEKKAGIKIVR